MRPTDLTWKQGPLAVLMPASVGLKLRCPRPHIYPGLTFSQGIPRGLLLTWLGITYLLPNYSCIFCGVGPLPCHRYLLPGINPLLDPIILFPLPPCLVQSLLLTLGFSSCYPR